MKLYLVKPDQKPKPIIDPFRTMSSRDMNDCPHCESNRTRHHWKETRHCLTCDEFFSLDEEEAEK